MRNGKTHASNFRLTLTTVLVEPKFTNRLTDWGGAPFTPVRTSVTSIFLSNRPVKTVLTPKGKGNSIPRFLASSAIKGKNEDHRASFGGMLSEELEPEPATEADAEAIGPINTAESAERQPSNLHVSVLII